MKLSLFIVKYVLVSMVDSLPGNGDRQRITSPEFYHHGQHDLHRDDHNNHHHHNHHHGNHHPRPRHGLCGSHNPGIAHSSATAGNAVVFLHKVKAAKSNRDGSLSCHTCCDQGLLLLQSYSVDRPILSSCTISKGY